MPEIDLEPDNYRVQTKHGRWINRDNWRFLFIYAGIIATLWIGFAWWHRAEISTVLLATTCLLVGLMVGIGIGGWLKRFD
jgi:hypothetical protein